MRIFFWRKTVRFQAVPEIIEYPRFSFFVISGENTGIELEGAECRATQKSSSV